MPTAMVAGVAVTEVTVTVEGRPLWTEACVLEPDTALASVTVAT